MQIEIEAGARFHNKWNKRDVKRQKRSQVNGQKVTIRFFKKRKNPKNCSIKKREETRKDKKRKKTRGESEIWLLFKSFLESQIENRWEWKNEIKGRESERGGEIERDRQGNRQKEKQEFFQLPRFGRNFYEYSYFAVFVFENKKKSLVKTVSFFYRLWKKSHLDIYIYAISFNSRAFEDSKTI